MKSQFDNPPTVLIIILNWNNAPDTINCIRSLKQIDYPNCEIILIDNGSNDNSVDEIRKAFPRIDIIEKKQNLGVAGGRNVGIEFALNKDNTPEYVLFLDNDTLVERRFLTEMIALGESDPTIGVLSPKIHYLEEPNRIWSAGGVLKLSLCKVSMRGEGEYDHGQYDKISDIDWALGCAFLITKKALKEIGKFDPVFGVYCGEEVDWCIRAKKLGYRIVYMPQSQVWHRISKTIPGSNWWYQKVRNHLIILRKHASYAQWLVFFSLFWFIVFRAIIRQVIYGTPKNIIYMAKGGLGNLRLQNIYRKQGLNHGHEG